jgi:pimeloyl-ACP methyl ester carboxylesterase
MFLPNLNEYQVILIDFLDQGQSSSIIKEYHHDIQIECVEAVVCKLGLEKFFLTGISYGSEVALGYTLKYMHKVEKLVVFNSASHTTYWLSDIGAAWQGAARLYDPEHFYNVTIPYIYSPYFYNKNAEWMANRKELLKGVFTKDFMDRMDRLIFSSESYDIRNRLSEIKVDTLVVACDQDYITPMAEGVRLSKGILNSELIILEQCGHASMYEKPEEFIEIIKDFTLR